MKKAKMMAIEEGVPLKTIVGRALAKETGEFPNVPQPWKIMLGSVISHDLKPEESAYPEDYDGPPPHDPIWESANVKS